MDPTFCSLPLEGGQSEQPPPDPGSGQLADAGGEAPRIPLAQIPRDYASLVRFLDAHWHKATLKRPVTGHPFDQLAALLAAHGSPQRGLLALHVTGSKGKGSICRLAADLLAAHGLRVGLFTSPHLERVEERIEVDGRPMAAEHLAARFGAVYESLLRLGLHGLGLFQVLWVVALEEFVARQVDVAVVEVRAGGRFDPTNIIVAPVAVVGPVSLEHVPGLGYTLAEIAWQKAGIIKPGALCLSAAQPPEAAAVVAAECERQGARLLPAGADGDGSSGASAHAIGYRVRGRDPDGLTVDLRTPWLDLRGARLGLCGDHQAENAALALAAAGALLARLGRPPEEAAARRALAAARWPARLDRLCPPTGQDAGPLVVYDGAHNRASAQALAHALTGHFGPAPWTFVLGVLGSKDLAGVLEALAPLADQVVATPVPGFACHPPAAIAEAARARGIAATAYDSPEAALAYALTHGARVCVTGTLYLYGPTRRVLAEREEGLVRAAPARA